MRNQDCVLWGRISNDDQSRFSLEGQEPQQVVERLEKKKIVLAVREIRDKKIIRASPHFFNSEVEIQKVVDEIKKL